MSQNRERPAGEPERKHLARPAEQFKAQHKVPRYRRFFCAGDR